MNFYTVLTTFFQFLINLIKNITILIVVTCYLLKAINMILEEKNYHKQTPLRIKGSFFHTTYSSGEHPIRRSLFIYIVPH